MLEIDCCMVPLPATHQDMLTGKELVVVGMEELIYEIHREVVQYHLPNDQGEEAKP